MRYGTLKKHRKRAKRTRRQRGGDLQQIIDFIGANIDANNKSIIYLIEKSGMSDENMTSMFKNEKRLLLELATLTRAQREKIIFYSSHQPLSPIINQAVNRLTKKIKYKSANPILNDLREIYEHPQNLCIVITISITDLLNDENGLLQFQQDAAERRSMAQVSLPCFPEMEDIIPGITLERFLNLDNDVQTAFYQRGDREIVEDALRRRPCNVCKKTPAEMGKEKHGRCSKCERLNARVYCSKECQLTNWKSGHKLVHQ